MHVGPRAGAVNVLLAAADGAPWQQRPRHAVLACVGACGVSGVRVDPSGKPNLTSSGPLSSEPSQRTRKRYLPCVAPKPAKVKVTVSSANSRELLPELRKDNVSSRGMTFHASPQAPCEFELSHPARPTLSTYP